MKITDREILFAGDWHGNLRQAVSVMNLAQMHQVSTIIQLGDFGIWHNDEEFLDEVHENLLDRGQRLFFIDGNHENVDRLYSYPLSEDGFRPIRGRVTHLPRNFQFKWGDLTVTALGGAFSVDQKWRKPGISWWPEELITEDEILVAQELPQTDILLTHDSPAGAPNPVTDNPTRQAAGVMSYGLEAIEQSNSHRAHLARVIPNLRPKVILHGHYHAYGRGVYQPFLPEDGHEIQVYSLDEGSGRPGHHTVILDRLEIKTNG